MTGNYEDDNPYGLEDPDKPLDEEEGLIFGLSQTVEFACGFCGSVNMIEFDMSGGMSQSLVQDCDACCRPNSINMHYSEEEDKVTLHSSFDG